jgi:hypothetical protein
LVEATNGGYSPHRTVASSEGDCSPDQVQGGDCEDQGEEEKEDEGPAPCTAQMGECTGGPDKDCATMFTSTLYYN